jgi:ABC-type multidrug transport system ATPase subunit
MATLAPVQTAAVPRDRARLGVRLAAVTRLFGETVALWAVDLSATSRELVAVAGANGSGKTTLLRIVAGLTQPTAGRVSWSTAGSLPPRIAYVGHEGHLFGDLTAAENVSLASRLARVPEAVGLEWLDRLEVATAAGRPVGSLSAGTRRRVALARAFATAPDVIVLDEPLASLDDAAVGAVAGVLAEARADGALVLASGHGPALEALAATRVIRLERGRIVATSTGRPAAGAVG